MQLLRHRRQPCIQYGLIPAMRTLRFLRHFSSQTATSTPRVIDLQGLGPKRFYDIVSTSPHPQHPHLHTILLDSKTVKTPRAATLATPSSRLSLAVAAEWDAQQGRIRPSSMPLTTLASTAQDCSQEEHKGVVDSMMRYVHTDTVCLRPAHPTELVEEQRNSCQPIVDALKPHILTITHGLLSATQPPSVVSQLQQLITRLDEYSLAAVSSAASSCKSVAIGLAMSKGVSAEQALAAARAEERWQARVWGSVEGGHDVDEADLAVRLHAVELLLAIVKEEGVESFQNVCR